jgi:mono/diheme cytochrome c family protein
MNSKLSAAAAAWLVLSTGCSGATPAAPDSVADAPSAGTTGAHLYEANCAACHQQDARGVPGVYPSLVGSPVVLGDATALARWVIAGQRPPSLPAARFPTHMPQFGWLKPGAAAALFTFLRSDFGNSAPPVTAASVADALDGPPGAQ